MLCVAVGSTFLISTTAKEGTLVLDARSLGVANNAVNLDWVRQMCCYIKTVTTILLQHLY